MKLHLLLAIGILPLFAMAEFDIEELRADNGEIDGITYSEDKYTIDEKIVALKKYLEKYRDLQDNKLVASATAQNKYNLAKLHLQKQDFDQAKALLHDIIKTHDNEKILVVIATGHLIIIDFHEQLKKEYTDEEFLALISTYYKKCLDLNKILPQTGNGLSTWETFDAFRKRFLQQEPVRDNLSSIKTIRKFNSCFLLNDLGYYRKNNYTIPDTILSIKSNSFGIAILSYACLDEKKLQSNEDKRLQKKLRDFLRLTFSPQKEPLSWDAFAIYSKKLRPSSFDGINSDLIKKELLLWKSIEKINNGRIPDMMKNFFLAYEIDKDGLVDISEARTLAEVGLQLEQFPFLRKGFDENKDGILSIQEKKTMLNTLVSFYDKDNDQRLNDDEIKDLRTMETGWGFGTFPLVQHFDRDGNQWLDLKERQEVIRAYSEHDKDNDGSFSATELTALTKWLHTSKAFRWDNIKDYTGEITPGQKSEKERLIELHTFYDMDGDGICSEAEANSAHSFIGLFSATIRTKHSADRNGNKKLDLDEKEALIKERLMFYDLNKDGHLFIPGKFESESDLHSSELYLGLEIEQTLTRMLEEPGSRQFDKDGDGWLSKKEREEFLAATIQDFDENKNGIADLWEQQKCAWHYSNLHQKELKRQEEEQRQRQQDAKILPRYDFNGNGKFDPEERQRAEADAKAGIQAPAME